MKAFVLVNFLLGVLCHDVVAGQPLRPWVGPHDKPFGLARTARDPHALDLVGALPPQCGGQGAQKRASARWAIDT